MSPRQGVPVSEGVAVKLHPRRRRPRAWDSPGSVERGIPLVFPWTVVFGVGVSVCSRASDCVLAALQLEVQYGCELSGFQLPLTQVHNGFGCDFLQLRDRYRLALAVRPFPQIT